MRNNPDWIKAFLDYSDHLESPRFMRFWAGVSCVAGALRRRVWIDQVYFRWFPNFFIIFVAPPGVVTKSTTADISMELLQEIPGIHFGPNSITWQALATAFAASCEHFEYQGEYYPMSAVTLVSRELGSLINPRDPDLVNLFIELWDGSKKYEKQTKMSGNDIVEAPWVNLIGATTPSWIANNVPVTMLGGGFVSRCIFLYAEEKAKFVAYLQRQVPPNLSEKKAKLIRDLEHISVSLIGEYRLTEDAYTWGEEWYENMWKGAKGHYSDDQVMGYLARKQTHVHKLAMVLSASKSDELVIELDTLRLAEHMLSDIEADMNKVFSKIGRSETSLQTERLFQVITRAGSIPYEAAYREIHRFFPNFRDFEGVLNGLIRSGQIGLYQEGDQFVLKARQN